MLSRLPVDVAAWADGGNDAAVGSRIQPLDDAQPADPDAARWLTVKWLAGHRIRM